MTTAIKKNDTKTVFAWSMYDFANSAFTTLIVTFIYATYFANSIVVDASGAPDPILGTRLWGNALAISAVFIALLSPIMGALADRGGHRKKMLFFTTVIAVLAAVGLFFPLPGQVMFALVIFVIGNVAFEMSGVFYNAYLPEIASPDRVGRISGYGWALGYVGGLLCLVIALVGFVQTETPWFGFTTELGENIRATNIVVAVWFAIFSIPIFLWLKEGKKNVRPMEKGWISETFSELADTFRELRQYRQVFRLLVARLVYNDGIVTLIAFGGIYAKGELGFTFEEILVFAIAMNVMAGLGAWGMGFLDDKLGGKQVLIVSIIGLLVATALAAYAPDKNWFWASGMISGTFLGPSQAASRSLMARFVPPNKENEFFGFFAFSGKATAFLGPLLLGIVTEVTNSQRMGVAVITIFFIVGIYLLMRVDEAEGIRLSGRDSI